MKIGIAIVGIICSLSASLVFADLIDFDTNPETGLPWGFDVDVVDGNSWRNQGVRLFFENRSGTIQRNVYVIKQGGPGHGFSTFSGDDNVIGGDPNTNYFISDDDIIKSPDPGTFVMQFDEKQADVSAALVDLDQNENWSIRAYRSDGNGGIGLISEIVMTPADGGDGQMAYFEFDLNFAEIVRVEAEYLGNSEPLGFAFDRVFFSPTAVPEPGSMALLGLVGLIGCRVKRKRMKSSHHLNSRLMPE